MNTATKWKQAAAERAAAERANEPTALVTLPGFEAFPFTGRRVPWGEWFRNGLIPQALANKLAAVHDGDEASGNAEALSGADAQAWVRLQQRVISAAVADPVIVFQEDHRLADNEVFAGELPD